MIAAVWVPLMLVGVALVLFAILSPAQRSEDIAEQKRAKKVRLPKRPRRRARVRSKRLAAMSAYIARLRATFEARSKERLLRDVGARRRAPRSVAADGGAERSPGEGDAPPTNTSFTAPTWTNFMGDHGKGELTQPQRLRLVRTLDAIDAPWCLSVLHQAAAQEGDAEILAAVAAAIAASSHRPEATVEFGASGDTDAERATA